jgi:hypothetical protein
MRDHGQPCFDIVGCVVRKMIQRRSFLTGLISLVAAPAIVRAGSLMPVRDDRLTVGMIVEARDKARLMTLIEYRNQIMREYLDANLFTPYMGDIVGSAPVRKAIA